MILSILKPFIFFSISHDYVTCNYGLYDHLVTGIISLLCFVTYITVMCDITLHPLSEFKIIEMKMKLKIKEKKNKKNKRKEKENEMKQSLMFTTLTLCSSIILCSKFCKYLVFLSYTKSTHLENTSLQ